MTMLDAPIDAVLTETVTAVPEPTAGMPEVSEPEEAAPPPVKRGRGRPKGSTKKPTVQVSAGKPDFIDPNGATRQNAAPPEPDAITPCADLAVMMVQSTGLALAGDAGALSPAEHANMRGGFVAYFKAKGINDVPPWVILAGCVAPYYAKVLTQPVAQSRVKNILGVIGRGVKGFFGKIFKRRFSNALPDRGNNGQREKHSGENDSGEGVAQ